MYIHTDDIVNLIDLKELKKYIKSKFEISENIYKKKE